MTESPVEIRSATAAEMPQVVAAIVAAFITDPVARFAWPAVHDHLRGMPRASREFAGKSVEHDTAYATTDFCGAALWLPPGVHPNTQALEAVFRETARAEHLDDLLATFEAMEKHHPSEPHWYLPFVGVEPNAQARGIGGALMRHALVRCDEQRALAYLESSNPRNIPFYERHGFEATGRIQVGGGPVVTPMLRQPRKPRSISSESSEG